LNSIGKYAAGLMFTAMMLVGGCASAPFRPVLPQEKEEYAIYTFVVDSIYLRGKAWSPKIEEYTVAGNPWDFPDSLSKRPDSLKHLPVSIMAYAAKHPKFDWFDLEHEYAIKNAKPWQLLAESFALTRAPDLRTEFSRGTASVTFSRVAFSSNFDEAILYVEYSSGKRRDNGSYLVFKRVKGLWTLVDRFGEWES
jgi:hypothetical protein